eukprot:1515261-Pyramimonas_sp.AAC.1
MLGPHRPPLLAAWYPVSWGSISGPSRSARDAPNRRRMEVGSCRGHRSLGGRSASGILSIHTCRSTDGTRTCSRRLGPTWAACQAWARRRQATNLAIG